MKLMDKYKAAKTLLDRPELKVERPAHKMEAITDEEKEAVGFCLALMAGLHKGDYKAETVEVCELIMPYQYYVCDQFMVLIAENMCTVNLQYQIEAYNCASNQIKLNTAKGTK